MKNPNIEIKNRKAEFLYFLKDSYTAGIQLYGTEIKSIREGKASLNEAFCYFRGEELFVKMHVSEYTHGGYTNHDPRRERKLLLTRRELNKLQTKVKTKGATIVPLKIFFNEKGLAKIEICLAEGKHKYDKRESVKEKDAKREMDRAMKF